MFREITLGSGTVHDLSRVLIPSLKLYIFWPRKSLVAKVEEKDRVRTAPLGLRGLVSGSAASHLSRARRNRQNNSVNFFDDFRRCLTKLPLVAKVGEETSKNESICSIFDFPLPLQNLLLLLLFYSRYRS